MKTAVMPQNLIRNLFDRNHTTAKRRIFFTKKSVSQRHIRTGNRDYRALINAQTSGKGEKHPINNSFHNLEEREGEITSPP